MTAADRNKRLRQLADQLGMIHKTILTKYSGPVAPMTPVLSKVVMIVGSEKSVNIKRIATLLMISSGAATQHVAALEETDIVKRVMSQEDRREIIVNLTPQGKTLYKTIHTKSLAILGAVFKELDDSELEVLVALVAKVNRAQDIGGV